VQRGGDGTVNKLLIVGARPLSLGMRVQRLARYEGFNADTAGITTENHTLDISDTDVVHKFMKEHMWDHVVCTVGVNMEGTVEGKGWIKALETQARTNYLGPMILLSEWARVWRDAIKEARAGQDYVPIGLVRHFVAISSNSAHIARANSGGYCASKAALSMGVRCAAREQASWPFSIYGYEPGWLEGTPMSEMVRTRLQHTDVRAATHRIPGGRGINPDVLAALIVHNIKTSEKALNGCMIRTDGGEQ
jgi:NAD(P)-dependent dehydrogenase (short-subunit alcohol dehydrogenase family)